MVINDNAELSKYLSKLAPLEARVNAMGRHGVFVCHYQAIASLVNLFSSYIPIAIATDIGPLNTPDTAYVNIEFCGKDTDKYLNRLEHSAEFMRNNQLSFAMTSGIMTFSHFVNFLLKILRKTGL